MKMRSANISQVLLIATLATCALSRPAARNMIFLFSRSRRDVPLTISPLSSLVRRQSCAETCGEVCYYQSTIDRAVSAGYELYRQNEQKGDYPHVFNNYEEFDFDVSGPYQEYPVTSDFEAYDGGSPGPDRVVFTIERVLAGTVTHTGASGGDFLECDG